MIRFSRVTLPRPRVASRVARLTIKCNAHAREVAYLREQVEKMHRDFSERQKNRGAN